MELAFFVVQKRFDSKQLANTAHSGSDVRKNVVLIIKECEITMCFYVCVKRKGVFLY